MSLVVYVALFEFRVCVPHLDSSSTNKKIRKCILEAFQFSESLLDFSALMILDIRESGGLFWLKKWNAMRQAFYFHP